MNDPAVADPFAHLKARASERSDRTVERLRAGVAALQASGRKITAESIKQIYTRTGARLLRPSFQVIRRNARAYALYRETADAFSAQPTPDGKQHRKRRRRAGRLLRQEPRSSYDLLQRLDKRDLALRIRNLERELATDRRLPVLSPMINRPYAQSCCGWRPRSSCSTPKAHHRTDSDCAHLLIYVRLVTTDWLRQHAFRTLRGTDLRPERRRPSLMHNGETRC